MHESEETGRPEIPRVLVYIVALVCGLLLALSVHIAFAAKGIGFTSMFRALFPTSTDQLDAALAWWAIGLTGCLGSWATILLLRKEPPYARSRTPLRVALAVVFFSILALAGHGANAAPVANAAMTTAANLAAMALGGFMAFFAAHFATRR